VFPFFPEQESITRRESEIIKYFLIINIY